MQVVRLHMVDGTTVFREITDEECSELLYHYSASGWVQVGTTYINLRNVCSFEVSKDDKV